MSDNYISIRYKYSEVIISCFQFKRGKHTWIMATVTIQVEPALDVLPSSPCRKIDAINGIA